MCPGTFHQEVHVILTEATPPHSIKQHFMVQRIIGFLLTNPNRMQLSLGIFSKRNEAC
jgi:hypothetical protein